MSQKAIEIAPILPTSKQDWTDLNRDGRRLDKVIKICFKRIKDSTKKETDPAVVLGYIAALNRTTHEKTSLATTVLGIRQVLEEAKKR